VNTPHPESYEEAFRHVLAHRTMLKAYVQAIVRDPVLAEDTFSEVTLEIARAWERFDRSRPLQTWARGVARRVALASLRKRSRQPIALDETVLEGIGSELDQLGNEVELGLRKEALQSCLDSLTPTNREVVQLRYFDNRSYDEISRALGRSVGALYAAVNRIHAVLHDCVRRKLRLA
jgi:RNA polymerase sigma-70 factor (ECF subfamily)